MSLATAGEVVDVPALGNWMKVNAMEKHHRVYITKKWLLENYEKQAAQLRIDGRTVEVPFETRLPQSFGGQLEHEGYSAPDMPAAALGTVSPATLTASMGISLQALMQSTGNNKASWIAARLHTMERIADSFGQNQSRLAHGDGSGALARVKGSPSADTPVTGQHTIHLDPDQDAASGYTFGLRYIERGMPLCASATKTGTALSTLKTASLRVLSVDRSDPDDPVMICTGTIGTLADNDYLFWGSRERPSKGRMPSGLWAALLDANVPTYLGIDRSDDANDWFRPHVVEGVGSSPLEREIQAAYDQVVSTHGGDPSVLLFNMGVWRRFAEELRVDRQFVTAAETGKYKGGTKMLVWNGADSDCYIVKDRDVPAGCILGLDWTTHKQGTLLDAGWLGGQKGLGENIFQRVPGVLEYVAVMVWMGQHFCIDPGKNFVLRGIDEI